MIETMKQTSLGLGQSSKRTRRRVFLEEMDRVVPWSELVALISPYMPEGRRGRPPFAVEVMLRIHFMQQWFTLSDPGMEEAFLTGLCTGSLLSLKSSAASLMRAPSCAFATGWRSTNWQSMFWV
jgi:hypothetical protein